MSNIDRTTNEIHTVLIHDEVRAVHVDVVVDGFYLIKNQNNFAVSTTCYRLPADILHLGDL